MARPIRMARQAGALRGLATAACLLLAACATPATLSPAGEADRLRRQGRHAEAYAAYAAALCGDPGDFASARRFVESWNVLGQPGTPVARLDCRLDPAVAAFVGGLAAGAQGDVDAALELLARAEADAPPAVHGEVAYRRGLIGLRAGRASEAREHLRRAAALQPERAELRIALAQAHVGAGEYGEAHGVLRGLMAIDVTGPQLDRARRVFTLAVKRAEPPLAETAAREVDEIFAVLERGEVGPETLERSLALAEKVVHPRVLTVAALVALDRDLSIEASRLLDKAAQLNRLDPEPMRVLGVSLYAAERPADALAPLTEAAQRDPFDVEVARMLAATANAVGAAEVARDTYRALTLLEPRVPEHYLWLARTERKLGRNEIARRAAERGCDLNADHVPLLVELGLIEAGLAIGAPTDTERHEARQRARTVVDRLLAVAPRHPSAATILAALDRR